MSALISGREHALYNGEVYGGNPGAWDSLAEAAEFIVADHIGALDFVAGNTTEKVRVSTARKTIAISGERIIRAVTELKINDTVVDPADYTARYWVVIGIDKFAGRSYATMTYDYGYQDPSEMPSKMREAILNTGASIFIEGGNKRSGKVKAEQLGDWSITYSGKDSASKNQISIPNDAQMMLRDFVNPCRQP